MYPPFDGKTSIDVTISNYVRRTGAFDLTATLTLWQYNPATGTHVSRAGPSLTRRITSLADWDAFKEEWKGVGRFSALF